jgi:hypothetical protein
VQSRTVLYCTVGYFDNANEIETRRKGAVTVCTKEDRV